MMCALSSLLNVTNGKLCSDSLFLQCSLHTYKCQCRWCPWNFPGTQWHPHCDTRLYSLSPSAQQASLLSAPSWQQIQGNKACLCIADSAACLHVTAVRALVMQHQCSDLLAEQNRPDTCNAEDSTYARTLVCCHVLSRCVGIPALVHSCSTPHVVLFLAPTQDKSHC